MDFFDLRLWPGFISAGGDSSQPALINQVAIDSRQINSSHSLFIALPGQETNGHRFVNEASDGGAAFALVHPSYKPLLPHSLKLLYTSDPVKSLQEIAKAYRNQLPTKIVAITGSYGKTMVKDLLQQMLNTVFRCKASPESFNSQIGVPLSLLTLSKNDEIGLIEAAISEKNEMQFLAEMLTPDYGIVTNVGTKHIDRLEDLSVLLKELVKLYEISDRLKWVCLPYRNDLNPLLEPIKSPLHYWNKQEPGIPHAEHLSEADALSIPYRISFPDAPPYQGEITSGFYYYLDLLNMAVKAAFKLGVPSEKICAALDHYVAEPIRTEIWKSPQNVTFINESYSEDPLSIDHALKLLKNTAGEGRKIFLFGGLKGAHSESDYRRIGSIISAFDLNTIYLAGPHDFKPLIEVVSKENPSTSLIKVASYKEAFELYKQMMHPDDTMLIKGEKKESLDTIMKCFHESLCTSICQINLAAVEHNIRIIKKKLGPNTRLMVMVKAFAYGTDPLRMAKFLKTCGIDILGVSYVEEAVALKRAGVSQDIFALNAAEYEIEKVVKWDLEVGVSDSKFIKALEKESEKQGKITKVHLHVDTGMSRFGCRPENALSLAKLIASSPFLRLEGIMTHFASADDKEEDAFTLSQSKQLEEVILELKSQGIEAKWNHASNSAAMLRFSFPQFNMARIGLAVYGLYASAKMERCKEIKHAISLISKIAGINICKKGDTISYGRSYLVTENEKKIAVLPIGYFDGLHRSYSGKSFVLIRGKKAPMVGNICMDFMMVDVTNIPFVKIGDPVLIFGDDDYGNYLSAEGLAFSGDSIVHELITCLGPRIQRVFIYEESQQKEVP